MKKEVILKASAVSKQYRLGTVGTGTITHDLNRWWARVRGKEDPYLKIGEVNDRSTKATSDYVWALKDINFEVYQGEVLGIIGKNGAGKSTLLKILSRVTAPTTGCIKTRGRIASLLEVGTGFNGEMTGRENIFLNGAILGMTKKEIKSKIEDIIAFSGCERYIDTPVKRYSSGMTVRLAFAVAAFLEPEILVIDEVLAVGDAEFQKKAIGKMQDISRGEGRTVIFVSHNMAAVKSLCTRGIVMENGGIVFEGGIEEAIGRYLLDYKLVDNKTSLFEMQNRSGNQKVSFYDFYIENQDEKRVNKILTGDDVKFVFVLKVNEDSKKINLGFSLHNQYEEILTYLYSDFQNIMFSGKHNEQIEVTCSINDFPFNEGKINIVGRIEVDGFESDWIKEPLGFIDVEKGDYYRSGKNGDINVPFLIKGDWNLSSK